MEETKQNQSQDTQKSTQDFYNSFFYIGWRPSLFWVITISAMYSFLVRPVIATVLFVTSGQEMSPLDTGTIVSLVAMVLGGSAIRGIEKISKHYKG